MATEPSHLTAWLTVLILGAAGASCAVSTASAQVRASAGGHYIHYGAEDLLLVGDSGTQCVLQDLNLDYRRWIDDCHAAGSVQGRDGSTILGGLCGANMDSGTITSSYAMGFVSVSHHHVIGSQTCC